MVKRERRIERVSEHVIEIEMRQAFAVGESIRVHHDESAERFGLCKERSEFWVR